MVAPGLERVQKVSAALNLNEIVIALKLRAKEKQMWGFFFQLFGLNHQFIMIIVRLGSGFRTGNTFH